MVQDVFNRLKFSRKKLGFSQARMASKSNFEQKDISRFENGKVKFIPIRYIIFLHQQGINLNWLYTGEGPVLIEELTLTDSSGKTLNTGPPAISPEISDQIDKQKEELLTLQVENKMLKKQVKELKQERKTLLEAFKSLRG